MIRIASAFLFSACVLLCQADATDIHVHALTAAKEYNAAASIAKLADYMKKNHKVSLTMSAGMDKAQTLPDLDKIEQADILLVYARRLNLPEAEMKKVRAHWEAGKPVIGIRTASHAFQEADNTLFDMTIMGGNYQGHYKNNKVTVLATEKAEKHPVMKNVMREYPSYRLYKTGPQIKSAVVLQRARLNEDSPWQAVTWVNEYKGGRMFYTSLGLQEDFENESFLRMIANAIFWVKQ